MKFRRFCTVFLLLALLLTQLWPVTAYAVEDIQLDAKAALLVDGATGTVLLDQDAHTKQYPASITKVMTALLVFEAIDRGELRLSDSITASANSVAGLPDDASTADIVAGETLTVEQLLYGLLLQSGNDAAVALAEQVAGVTELFVQQMNNRAMELGMGDTHFVNPTGLPAEGHVTSAWDIALMSRELILHHPDIRRFTTIWMDTIRGGEFGLSNTNKLIRFYDGATGLKTGSTDSALYCLSATAERDGMELIAVVLGSETSQQRFEDAKTMLNYGFSTYVLADITPEETPMAPVRLGRTPSVEASLTQSKLLVGKGQAGDLTRTVKLQEDRRHSHGAEWGYHPGRASSDGSSGRGTHDLGGPVYPPAPRRGFRIRNQAVFSCIFHRLDVT